MQIEGRTIGPGNRTFVIAEIGVNHNGSPERAIELACVAAACGADAVKLQFFSPSRLVHPSGGFAEYQKSRVEAASPAEMLAKYELSRADAARVVRAVRDLGRVPLATPFSVEDVELVEQLGLPAVKIASPDLVNRPLLARAARLGKPLLVSTGAATMDEVEASVGWLRQWGASFALLHCVSGYPVPADQANLCWISELAARFDVPVGYSDHTTLPLSGAAAVAHGAAVVERHLTYDRAAEGPDHAASSDPQQFAQYVRLIREAELLRGTPGKRVLGVEKDVRKVSRQSLVAARALRHGEPVRECDLTVQRPGTGIPASAIDQVIRRRVRLAVPAGTMLTWNMIGDAVPEEAA
jgi:N-acetylneuraminate synthase/N,N'-diacetyllegionaminate synthase